MPQRHVVLAEYFTIREKTLLFLLRSDWLEPRVFSLEVDQNRLRRFIAMHFGKQNRVHQLASMSLERTLHYYDYLIEPIVDGTDPDDIICLVPHSLLHYMPIHALKSNEQYLIERNPTVYSPSASVLRYCQANRTTNRDGSSAPLSAVVLGDSRSDLPSAQREAEVLGALLDTVPIIGNQVTKQALLAHIRDVDIVHFAGHAFFNSDQSLESGLLLAGDEVLTAREIFGLRGLHTNLVTLSGCETAVNDNLPGDELIGLTRAFLYAGTSSVLVSLWRVADASTHFLMGQFYTHLRRNSSVYKVDALRQAILETKAVVKWESFYYWAPFVLVGDWV